MAWLSSHDGLVVNSVFKSRVSQSPDGFVQVSFIVEYPYDSRHWQIEYLDACGICHLDIGRKTGQVEFWLSGRKPGRQCPLREETIESPGSAFIRNAFRDPMSKLAQQINVDTSAPSKIEHIVACCSTHLVILCNPGEGEGPKERLDRWLTRRGLVLNERKTRVIESRESGFEFLRFAFRWHQSKKGTLYAHVEPGSRAMQELRNRVRALTRRTSTWKDKEAVVNEINRVTRGWGNLFALAHYQRIFPQMNGFTANRLRQWLWRKHGNASGKYRRWPDYKPRTLRTADTSSLKIATEKWNSESRMRENRLSGLMRGGSLAVIGCKSSHSVGSCLLYTVMELGSEILKVDDAGRV